MPPWTGVSSLYERYERVKRRGLHKGKTPKTFKIKKHHQMQTLKIKAGTDKGQPSKKKKKKKKKKKRDCLSLRKREIPASSDTPSSFFFLTARRSTTTTREGGRKAASRCL